MPNGTETSFEAATRAPEQGLLREFRSFMSENAKWWLSPFLAVFAMLSAALVLGSSGAAPFIYSMF